MHQPNEKAPHSPTQSDNCFQSASLSSKTIALGTVDLGPLTEKMREHNEMIRPGLTLARVVSCFLNEVKDTPREERDQKVILHKALQEEDSRRCSVQASFEADIAPTLQATGLKIGPLKSAWQIVSSETDFQSSRLAFHIGDAAQFATYLSALDPATVTASQKNGLNSLAHSLCNQLRSDYDYNQSDDRLLSLVCAVEAIEKHFDRLALPLERFDTYIHAIRGRYLRDLIRAEKLQLDKPFGKGDNFTLHWHRDSNPKDLQAKWHEVLDTLVSLVANPTANKLYAQARETAQAAMQNSLSEVGGWADPAANSYEARKPTFLRILKQIEMRLTEF